MDDQVEWPVFGGIDWAGQHHQLCIVDHGGRRLTERRFPHDVAGLAQLQGELSRHGARLPIAVSDPKACWSSICRPPAIWCSRCHRGSLPELENATR
jgi:hypothetical protein